MTPRKRTLRGVKRAYEALLYLGLAFALCGCVPIGVRVQNMFA
ncbi:MAG TPA: hypothetical protein VFS06_09800 [Casimicrobiaceae bacterium]|jgi:hypothetical protein|nr:hypothetical protein [Casimicrobiaceae bacterium]HET9749581.1 hypothetical protein [Casimicrobiaceae bacterium]HWD17314.1 hypothetical protein [Casimicrobiaceae bacterium]HWD35376.1 hypothetical protein [Casimicrobiaceae bacterium]